MHEKILVEGDGAYIAAVRTTWPVALKWRDFGADAVDDVDGSIRVCTRGISKQSSAPISHLSDSFLKFRIQKHKFCFCAVFFLLLNAHPYLQNAYLRLRW